MFRDLWSKSWINDGIYDGIYDHLIMDKNDVWSTLQWWTEGAVRSERARGIHIPYSNGEPFGATNWVPQPSSRMDLPMMEWMKGMFGEGNYWRDLRMPISRNSWYEDREKFIANHWTDIWKLGFFTGGTWDLTWIFSDIWSHNILHGSGFSGTTGFLRIKIGWWFQWFQCALKT